MSKQQLAMYAAIILLSLIWLPQIAQVRFSSLANTPNRQSERDDCFLFGS